MSAGFVFFLLLTVVMAMIINCVFSKYLNTCNVCAHRAALEKSATDMANTRCHTENTVTVDSLLGGGDC